MKYIVLLLTLLVALQASVTEKKEDPFKKIEYFKLDNGMEIYLMADKKAEKTSVELSVKVGSKIEDDAHYGLAHLVEHVVFRDRRIPHFDYLDYIKEEGGTDVNGYTRDYTTGYLASIGSEKSLWLIETFAKMIFDKNVSNEDLRVERKALQAEVGKPKWYYGLFSAIARTSDKIFPPEDNVFKSDFGMDLPAREYRRHLSFDNVEHFTLDTVMSYYDRYYYPANMKMIVVGNFDATAMKKRIEETFGMVKKSGTQSAEKPVYKPSLNGKPYRRFTTGEDENYAYIGAKYLFYDYRKFVILDTYVSDLSDRLQQQLRNIEGKTYSVWAENKTRQKAGVAAVVVAGLNEDFDTNIATAKEVMSKDIAGMSEQQVTKILEQREESAYMGIEHDVDTLKSMVDSVAYLREEHNISDKTPYDIFRSITPEIFNETIQEVFTPQNRFLYIYRDYYFFPSDSIVLILFGLFLAIYAYIVYNRKKLRKAGVKLSKRDIVFHRRLSSVLIGFIVGLITILIANFMIDWFVYGVSKFFTGNPNYVTAIDAPYSYLGAFVYIILTIFSFAFIYQHLWHYYANLIVTDKWFLASGTRTLIIAKEDISIIGIVSWKERKKGKTLGFALAFWKPLVSLETKEGECYYLRTSNAEHLKEDLEKWLAE